MNGSEETGWHDNPSGHPYGLSCVSGEKVDVCFGQLGRSFWYEHSSSRVRIMFSFNNPLGLLALTHGHVMRESFWYPESHQVCIIPPGLLTALDWLRKAPLVVLLVDPSLFKDVGGFPFWPIIRDLPPARGDPHLAQLAHMFHTLCVQLEHPEPDFVQGLGIALASRTITHCLSSHRSIRKPRPGLPPALIDKIIQYIDDHLAGHISAKELAAQAGLSPDHFARRFRIALGTSPKQFILRRRVDKVADLLRSGRFNVTEAARETGFHDLSHLNRAFKKFFGYSPKSIIVTTLASDNYR